MRASPSCMLLAALLGAAGCFSGTPDDGAYACAAPPRQCPDGFVCDTDGRCRHTNTNLTSCSDGQKNGDESDLDCGGSCPGCEPGRACGSDGDCATSTCIDRLCELATAPPFWTPVAALLRDRAGPAATADAVGAIYVVGGADASSPYTSSAEGYSLSSQAWSPLPPMLFSRSDAAVSVAGPNVYALTGVGNANKVEHFDGAKWIADPDLPFSTSAAGYATLSGTLYLLAGQDPAAAGVRSDAHSFASGVLSTLADLGPRAGLAAADGGDGHVYALGGHDGSGALASVSAYSLLAPSWSSSLALPAPRDSLAAARGADGRVYAIGGLVAGAPVASVIAWLPGAARWASIAPLSNPRARLAAATAADGRIYAIGGQKADGTPLRDVDAYGPIVELTPSTISAGATFTARGRNFAPLARVQIFSGLVAMGTPLATTTSDAQGAFADFPIPPPSSQPGAYPLTILDHRSRYPIVVYVTIQ